MNLVVDASVAVKWVVAEDDHAEAVALSEGRLRLAPDFVLVEVASILWKKVRASELAREQARDALAFVRGAFTRLSATTLLLDRALEIALAYNHPVYDCVYLAHAELERAELLTADRRLADLARRMGTIAVHPIGRARP